MSEWTSVEDRLPEDCVEIIVCRRFSNGNRIVTAEWFYDTKGAGWHEVTHWMPLPEPPQS